jgi:hypothetical protein
VFLLPDTKELQNITTSGMNSFMLTKRTVREVKITTPEGMLKRFCSSLRNAFRPHKKANLIPKYDIYNICGSLLGSPIICGIL